MFCLKCNNELLPGEKFCVYCGTSTENASPFQVPTETDIFADATFKEKVADAAAGKAADWIKSKIFNSKGE